MNLKLKKVVKNNIVDYGASGGTRRGFEEKFRLYSIIKDYKDIFERKSQSSNKKLTDNKAFTEREYAPNKYYKKILYQNKAISRLKNIRYKFKNLYIKNKAKLVDNFNHTNNNFRLIKSLNLKRENPFYDSFRKNFLSLQKVNKEEFKKTSENIIKSISNIDLDETNFHEYQTKYKKINNIKKLNLSLKKKILLGKKYDGLNNPNLSINFFNNSYRKSKILLLKNKKDENENAKKNYNETEKDENVFENEFDNDKILKNLKKKYQFFHLNKLDMDEINNRYFLMLRNMLKINPGVKLHNDAKESHRKIRKMKDKYYNMRPKNEKTNLI